MKARVIRVLLRIRSMELKDRALPSTLAMKAMGLGIRSMELKGDISMGFFFARSSQESVQWN